jgi:signal transduction histidine kinase
LEVRLQELTEVLEVISSISSILSLDEILAEVTERTARIVGADSCAISEWNWESNSLVVLADYVSPQADLPFENSSSVGATYPLAHFSPTEAALRKHIPLIVYVDDPDADEAEKELLQALGWNGVLMAPMVYKGQAIGLMQVYLDVKSQYRFRDEDVTLCQTLANQAAVAIENAQLYQEAEDGRLHAEAIQVIGRALASELDYERIVYSVANFAYRLVGAQFVYVAVPKDDEFRLVAAAGRDEGYAGVAGSTQPLFGMSIEMPLRQACVKKAPIVVADVLRDPTFDAWQAEAEAREVKAIAAVPLLSHDRVMGVLVAHSPRPDFFDPDSVAILMALASQAAVAIQNAQLVAQLEAQREALRRVSLRLVNAQEEERRRISRELHDELGQALTALKINLEVANRSLTVDVPHKLHHSIQEAMALAIHALETVRDMSLELRPTMLDDLGLISALRWEIDRYEQRTGQNVEFEADLASTALESELEITLYRIIIEALTNVARHAHASHIRVSLWVRSQEVFAGVEDDGIGFDADDVFGSSAEKLSLGLIGMRERAELLGGRLEVLSAPGSGTKVRARLPLGDLPPRQR